MLRIADLSDPDHLNPYLSELDVTYNIASLVYSFLIVSDAHGRLIGDLATEVPSLSNGGISPDGRTYTYHLAHGVTWHDGVPFTSRDVVASWNAVMDPSHNALHREGYDRIASINTPNDWTIVVHLKERYPPLVTQFFTSLQEGAKPILPAHILIRDKDFDRGIIATQPIGTGPFRFVSWERGTRIVLERYDRYFKGQPKLERIEFRVIPDPNTILTEMRLHHVDLVMDPQAVQYEMYRSLRDVTVTRERSNAQIALIFNVRKPGLNDVAVRRAVASAIDYSTLIDKLAHGVAEPAYNTLPPTALGYIKLPPHRYDPAAAARLLDAAGWKTGTDDIRTKDSVKLSFTLAAITGSATAAHFAVILQQELRAVGIDLAIKDYSPDVVFTPDGPIYKGTYDFAFYGTTLSWDPSVLSYLGCDQVYPHGENIFGYCNSKLDKLENAGLQYDNPAKRVPIYHEASRIIWDTIPYLPLYQYERFTVHSPDLKNFSENPSATPWWNAYQWDI